MLHINQFPAFLAALLMAPRIIAADDLDAKLSTLPKPWSERMHRLTLAEYEATLPFWAKRHADVLDVEKVGASHEGMGVHLLRITDRSVPDADKQIALITALHGGPERSGSTTALALAERLLGDTAEAREIRRKQIVLIMPIPNPHAFFTSDRFGNALKIDPYNTSAHWDLPALTLKNPERAPEVMAVLGVMDRYKPDVHCDLHGTGLQEYADAQLGDRTGYQGQIMFEITGSAYSNYSLRPWDWRITEAMMSAGETAGFPSDRFEADAQRCFAGPGLESVASRFWSGRPLFYTAQYGYAKYHTLICANEIAWENSGIARTLGLIKIGNASWRGEPVPGYPVNRVRSFVGHFIVAMGADAAARREARVALWQDQTRFTQAILYPQTDMRDSYVVALDPEGAALLDPDPQKFAANLRSQPGIDADAVSTFIKHGPEIKLAPETAPAAKSVVQSIQHDLGLLLRLPYRAPEIVDLRLNGHPVAPDASHRWLADGWTHVLVSVKKEQAAREHILVVTCAYKPDQQRHTGWTPPAEAMRTTGKGER